MSDELVKVFRSIPTDEGRSNALCGLVNVLNPIERHATRAALEARDDPVAFLPQDVLLLIFDQLPIRHTWKLQFVSRRWRAALSSYHFLLAAVVRWELHDPFDLIYRESHYSDGIALERRLHRMRAWQSGRPFTFAIFPCPQGGFDKGEFTNRRVQLIGDKVATLIISDGGECRKIDLFDLKSFQRTSIRTSSHEAIQAFVLGSNLIAFVTYNAKLYVAPHCSTSGEIQGAIKLEQSYRLPSARVMAIEADKHFVAVLMGWGFGGNFLPDTIIMLETESQQLKSFSLSAEAINRPNSEFTTTMYALRVDATARVVELSLCYILDCEGADEIISQPHNKGTRVSHIRFSFDADTSCLDQALTREVKREYDPFTISVARSSLGSLEENPPRYLEERGDDLRRDICAVYPRLHANINRIFGEKYLDQPSNPSGRDRQWQLLALNHTYAVVVRKGALPSAEGVDDDEYLAYEHTERHVFVFCFDEAINMPFARFTGL